MPDAPVTPTSTANTADPVAPETPDVTPENEGEGEKPADLSADPKLPKAEAKKEAARIKKLKLKVDGKELEEEVNLDDDEYLTKQLQLAKAAQKRMGEYANLEKQVKAFLDELKKNPRKVLSDPNIGIDVKQLAASIIEEEIENSKKSPEQLEREKLETRLRELEEERKKEKEDFQTKEFERLQQQAYERYDMQMSQALEKSDLPKSPYIIKKMADYMLMGLNEGLDITPEDVLPLVREEMQNDLKQMFAVMPDEVIESIVGKDVFNRIRKKSVAKAKTPPTPLKSSVKDTGGTNKGEATPVKKQSFRDFFGV
jgi:hypothetical protein